MTNFILADYLSTLNFKNSPHTFVEIRNLFEKAGLRQQERELTYAIERGKRIQNPGVESVLKWVLFEFPSNYGLTPLKPLYLILIIICFFTVPYSIAIKFSKLSGIWKVWPDKSLSGSIEHSPDTQLKVKGVKCISWGAYFSIISAFRVGWRDINIGSWIEGLQMHDFSLRAKGWVRTLAGIQSLICVFLLVLWVLTYFGRPFK